jgi:hypothetical protein
MPRREHVAFSLTDYAWHSKRSPSSGPVSPRTWRAGHPRGGGRRVESACRTPELGLRKVAAALAEDGVEVSASGVRWILKRYELHRSKYRVRAIREGRIQKVVEAVRQLRSG